MFEREIGVYKKVIDLAQVVRYEYESNHHEDKGVNQCDNLDE